MKGNNTKENRTSRTMRIPFPPDSADRLMDLEEVRLRLGATSMDVVIALTTSGELPCLMIGRRKLVRKVTFDRFLEKLENGGGDVDIKQIAVESGFYHAGEFKGAKGKS